MNRILYFSHSSLLSGAELAFYEAVRALRSSGNELICIFPKNGPLVEKCSSFTERSIITPLPWWFSEKLSLSKKVKLYLKILKSSNRIRQIIKETKPDRILVNTITIPSPAMAGKRMGIPVFWFIHETGDAEFSLVYGKRWTRKKIARLSTRIICNSVYIKSILKESIPEEKIFVANQSVNINPVNKKEPGKDLIIGMVGRISEQKGQEEALKALKKIPGAGIRLVLAGYDKGIYADKIRSLISEYKLEDQVEILGPVSEMNKFYSKIDIVLSCGRNEAMGRSSIEAMKHGLAVIVPDGWGHAELVNDNFNGLKYTPGDISMLADKIQLLRDAELRQRLGENGRKWARDNFHEKSFSKQLKSIMEL